MRIKLVARLLLLFLLAQVIGIAILTQYIDFQATASTGVTTTTEAYIVAPPKVENESYTFISIILAIIIGTILILWLIKLNAMLIWKLWFLLSVSIAISYALFPAIAIILPQLAAILVTLAIAIAIGYFKIFRANYAAHTAGELLIYGGLAALFVPVLNLTSAIILLVLLAIYDYYMVNKAGHMVTLAKASMDSKLISGLYVGEPASHKIHAPRAQKAVETAAGPAQETETTGIMVGGGDIAFPLFFAGALMKFTGDLASGLIVAACATASLAFLFWIGQRGKFYPAIPFVAAGCLIGLGIALLA